MLASTYSSWTWNPGPVGGFSTFQAEITPRSAPAGLGIFWAAQFWFHGGDGGYMGIQTLGQNGMGHVAIFAIWKALAASGPRVAEPFGGEGTGYHCVVPFDWRFGSPYRLTLVRGMGGWWACQVEGTVTQLVGKGRKRREELVPVLARVGEVQVPVAWGGLQGASTVFTEHYGGTTDCYPSPAVSGDFGSLTMDFTPPQAGLTCEVQTTQDCANSSSVALDGGARHQLGVSVFR